MNLIKISIILLIINGIQLLSVDCVTFHITKLESCSTSNKSMEVRECEARGRKFTVVINIHRALSKLNVQFNLFKLEGDEFKQIFKSKHVNWCDLVMGKTKANPVVKTFIKSSLDRLPPLVRKCPMQGEMELRNIALNTKPMAILPHGLYRLSARAFDSIDKQIILFTILFQLED